MGRLREMRLVHWFSCYVLVRQWWTGQSSEHGPLSFIFFSVRTANPHETKRKDMRIRWLITFSSMLTGFVPFLFLARLSLSSYDVDVTNNKRGKTRKEHEIERKIHKKKTFRAAKPQRQKNIWWIGQKMYGRQEIGTKRVSQKWEETKKERQKEEAIFLVIRRPQKCEQKNERWKDTGDFVSAYHLGGAIPTREDKIFRFFWFFWLHLFFNIISVKV